MIQKKSRIYIDTSALKRPFDNPSTPRIRVEAEAVVSIIEAVEAGKLHLIGSEALDFENSRNAVRIRREWMDKCLKLAVEWRRITADVAGRAADLSNSGMRGIDALHVACAEAGECDILLTCDDRLLKKAVKGGLRIMNPVDFVVAGMGVEQ